MDPVDPQHWWMYLRPNGPGPHAGLKLVEDDRDLLQLLLRQRLHRLHRLQFSRHCANLLSSEFEILMGKVGNTETKHTCVSFTDQNINSWFKISDVLFTSELW